MILICPSCKRSIHLTHPEEVRLQAGILQTTCPSCQKPYVYPLIHSETQAEKLEVNN